MSTTTLPPLPETINLVGSTTVAGLLINAIGAALPSGSPEMERIVAAHRAAPDRMLPVTFTVAGVTVPLTAAIEAMWQVRSEDLNRRASKRALDLVSAAGLDQLAETMRRIDWQLKEALTKVGAEFPED